MNVLSFETGTKHSWFTEKTNPPIKVSPAVRPTALWVPFPEPKDPIAPMTAQGFFQTLTTAYGMRIISTCDNFGFSSLGVQVWKHRDLFVSKTAISNAIDKTTPSPGQSSALSRQAKRHRVFDFLALKSLFSNEKLTEKLFTVTVNEVMADTRFFHGRMSELTDMAQTDLYQNPNIEIQDEPDTEKINQLFTELFWSK